MPAIPRDRLKTLTTTDPQLTKIQQSAFDIIHTKSGNYFWKFADLMLSHFNVDVLDKKQSCAIAKKFEHAPQIQALRILGAENSDSALNFVFWNQIKALKKIEQANKERYEVTYLNYQVDPDNIASFSIASSKLFLPSQIKFALQFKFSYQLEVFEILGLDRIDSVFKFKLPYQLEALRILGAQFYNTALQFTKISQISALRALKLNITNIEKFYEYAGIALCVSDGAELTLLKSTTPPYTRDEFCDRTETSLYLDFLPGSSTHDPHHEL